MTDKPKRESRYVIMGKPVPWARPGKTKWSSVAYDTQKDQKAACGWELKAAHLADPLFSGALHIDMIFYMPMCTVSKRKIYEREGEWHIFKPDIDNLVKFILDAATGILFADDCIISSITAKKIYNPTTRTEITVTEL